MQRCRLFLQGEGSTAPAFAGPHSQQASGNCLCIASLHKASSIHGSANASSPRSSQQASRLCSQRRSLVKAAHPDLNHQVLVDSAHSDDSHAACSASSAAASPLASPVLTEILPASAVHNASLSLNVNNAMGVSAPAMQSRGMPAQPDTPSRDAILHDAIFDEDHHKSHPLASCWATASGMAAGSSLPGEAQQVLHPACPEVACSAASHEQDAEPNEDSHSPSAPAHFLPHLQRHGRSLLNPSQAMASGVESTVDVHAAMPQELRGREQLEPERRYRTRGAVKHATQLSQQDASRHSAQAHQADGDPSECTCAGNMSGVHAAEPVPDVGHAALALHHDGRKLAAAAGSTDGIHLQEMYRDGGHAKLITPGQLRPPQPAQSKSENHLAADQKRAGISLRVSELPAQHDGILPVDLQPDASQALSLPSAGPHTCTRATSLQGRSAAELEHHVPQQAGKQGAASSNGHEQLSSGSQDQRSLGHPIQRASSAGHGPCKQPGQVQTAVISLLALLEHCLSADLRRSSLDKPRHSCGCWWPDADEQCIHPDGLLVELSCFLRTGGNRD